MIALLKGKRKYGWIFLALVFGNIALIPTWISHYPSLVTPMISSFYKEGKVSVKKAQVSWYRPLHFGVVTVTLARGIVRCEQIQIRCPLWRLLFFMRQQGKVEEIAFEIQDLRYDLSELTLHAPEIVGSLDKELLCKFSPFICTMNRLELQPEGSINLATGHIDCKVGLSGRTLRRLTKMKWIGKEEWFSIPIKGNIDTIDSLLFLAGAS